MILLAPLALVACGGLSVGEDSATRGDLASARSSVESPGSAPEPPDSTAGEEEVAGASECEDVCTILNACGGPSIPECFDACVASAWVETHAMHCLALRVYWIDEEGCDAMLAAYDGYQPDDPCAD